MSQAGVDRGRVVVERDGTIRIRIGTTFAVGDVNCFVLPGDPLTIVDAGHKTQTSLDDLEAGLGQVGLRIEDVEQVLLTHHHADHVGLARTIRARSGCAVAGQRMLLDYLPDIIGQRASETDYHVAVMELNGAPPEAIVSHRALQVELYEGVEPVPVTAPFDDGAVLEAGGRRLRAVVRPGHSATDTLFVDDDRGVAFVGDHLLRDKSSDPLVWRPPVARPDPARRESVLALYRAAMSETALLDVDLMHAGHDDPIEGHAAALIATRLHEHDRHCARVLKELSSRPLTAFEVARAIWGRKVDEKPYDLISMVIGSLDLLCAGGPAHVETRDDGVVVYTAA